MGDYFKVDRMPITGPVPVSALASALLASISKSEASRMAKSVPERVLVGSAPDIGPKQGGYYNPRRQFIGLQLRPETMWQQGSPTTLKHELGHFIDLNTESSLPSYVPTTFNPEPIRELIADMIAGIHRPTYYGLKFDDFAEVEGPTVPDLPVKNYTYARRTIPSGYYLPSQVEYAKQRTKELKKDLLRQR